MQNMNYNYNYTDFHIDDFLIKNEPLDSSLMSNSPSPQEFSFEDNHSERSYNLTAITTSLSSDSFEETSLTEEKETKNKTKKKKKPVVKKRVLKKKKTPSTKKVLTDVPIEIIKGNKVYFHPRNLLSIDPNSTAAKNILKETKKKVRNSDFDILEFTSATRSVDDILELLWEAINGIYIPMSSCNELFISQDHMDEVFQMMVKRAHQPKIPETQNVVRFNWNHYKEKLSDPQAKSKISNRRKERRRKRERIQQVADNTTKKRVLKSKSEITNNDIDKMTAQFEEEIKFSCDSQNDPFDQNDLVDHQYDDGFFSIFEEEPQINFYEIEEKNTTPYSNKQVVPKMIDFAPRFGVVHNPNYLHITGEYLSSTSLIPLYYVFPHNAPTSSTSPLTGTTLSIENQRMFVSLPSFSEPCSLWIFLQVPFTTTVTTCPNPIYHVLSNAEYSMKKKPNGPNGGNDQGGDGFNFNDSNMGGGSGFGGGNNNFFNGGNNSFGGGNNFNSGNNGGNNGNNGGFGGFQFNDFQPTSWKEGNIWHLACGSGNLSMINFLHQKRIPHIDSRDENGKTPLMWAIHNSHLHVVKLLFKLGAKFNLADNDGNTALHLAVSKNEVAIVEYMLHCGSVDVNNVNKEEESALDFALALDIVPMIKILLSHPSTLARNSITYWFPDCPNFKKWWYNTKDLQELVNLSNNDLVKKTMITRIELEQYNSELKKELSEKKVDFEEFAKRSQNEIQKLGRSYKENKEKMNQTQDKLLQSKKALRDLKEEKNKLTNKVDELLEYNEIKDNEISRLKEALEKAQRELLEAKSTQTTATSTESRPKRTKKKINLLESSKSFQRYNPKKILKKTQSSKSLSKSESKSQFTIDMNQLGVFNFKQIYSTIIDQVGKYTPLSYPLNFNQMDDDDIVNHVVESDQQSLKTILSEIVNAIQDGGIKNPNELSNAVKIAVQMRYITN